MGGDYERNRHFFLSQYFRDNYEKAMANLPAITSAVNITKIEVWITNKKMATDNTRDIVAFMDLGEGSKDILSSSNISDNPARLTDLPHNDRNYFV
jgi:cell surface protein SprA